MQLSGLSLQQAPPVSVPFRFFLSAPVFGMLAAVLLIWWGDEALGSRWTPAMLAITHALVLGFFTSIMFGAMQQMLPVLAGAVITRPRLVAWLLYLSWMTGVVTLLLAFLVKKSGLFAASIVLLGMAVLVFAWAVGTALMRASSQSQSLRGMKLAVLALLLTLVLGMVLAWGHTGNMILLRPWGTNLHLMWGLVGWVGMLIVSVAWQVVPMFQITKEYPNYLVQWLAPCIFGLLLIRSFVSLGHFGLPHYQWLWQLLSLFAEGLVSLLFIAFALQTLRLQHYRRRKIKDYHIHYWQLACGSLLLSVACWWGAILVASWQWPVWLLEPLHLLAVTFFVVGFVMAVMTAMLYKIVAFLIWLHLHNINTQLQMAGKSGTTVPHMKTIISNVYTKIQFQTYLLALGVILPAVLWPVQFARLAGVAWFIFFAMMALNLGRALSLYRRFKMAS
ncbi:MAG: hypothetical protein GY881_14380 [Gammaproteobacteria bacterium]|nr:hypothetical protein [Gammaproteobacteria bacterium]